MPNYTIKAGHRTTNDLADATPYIFPYSVIRNKSLFVRGWFPAPPFDAKGDKDLQYDWSKLPGISLRLYPSNKDFICVAFRPAEDGERWELAAFSNNSATEKLFETGGSVFVDPGEQFEYFITPKHPRLWKVRIRRYAPKLNRWLNQDVDFEFDISLFLLRHTRIWFGGTKTAPEDVKINLQSFLK
jgi:hypothetical protein